MGTLSEVEAVEQAMKKPTDKRMYERYLAVRLRLEGQTLEQIANTLHRTRKTIWNYLHKYRDGGLGSLGMNHSTGNTFIVFLPTILESRYHLGPANIGLFSLALMAFHLIGSKASGKLQGNMGSVKVLFWAGVLLIASLVVFIFAAQLSIVKLLISLMLTGFIIGLAVPALPVLLSSEFVAERATAMGVYIIQCT